MNINTFASLLTLSLLSPHAWATVTYVGYSEADVKIK